MSGQKIIDGLHEAVAHTGGNTSRYAQVELVERVDHPGVWSVEAVDHDGGVEQTMFYGPDAHERAAAYEKTLFSF
jgi:hypothetical protein